jgi:hypothetical protein
VIQILKDFTQLKSIAQYRYQFDEINYYYSKPYNKKRSGPLTKITFKNELHLATIMAVMW